MMIHMNRRIKTLKKVRDKMGEELASMIHMSNIYNIMGYPKLSNSFYWDINEISRDLNDLDEILEILENLGKGEELS